MSGFILRRIAGESPDEEGFLDEVVVQVARAVEIGHVKVLVSVRVK